MKAVIQRVSYATVSVDGICTGKIKTGVVILLGVEQNDSNKDAEILAHKIAGLRVFCDENDKINLSLSDVQGSVLVISNFTLCADCRHGRRPYFGEAASPDVAESLYEYFCACMKNEGINNVQTGVFGGDMKLELLNDGPVTIILQSDELKTKEG